MVPEDIIMDFRELTYITAVAEERSVTEAAKRLYISQPSLSYIISKVEQDLGVRLFDRKTNPLSLTYAGEIYVEHAREILRIRDNMRRELTDIGHGKKGRINIGIPNERAGYMLSRVMPLFRQQYPNMEIRLQESRSSEIIRNLLIDKIGFAVLPGDKSDLPPGLKAERIYRENLYVVAGDGVVREEDLVQEETGEGRKPLKAMSAAGIPMPVVRLQNLKDRPFIIVKEGTFIRRRMEDIFREAGFFPKEIMEVANCISAVQLARAGLGYTITPERAIIVLGGYDSFNCFLYGDSQDSWDVSAVYREDVYLDQAERALIGTMKQVFGKEERREET
jgi:DNA-binding transcriptional LysR family regulator